jgi:hypothetical protein
VRVGVRLVAALCLAAALGACGIKGDPVAPSEAEIEEPAEG